MRVRLLRIGEVAFLATMLATMLATVTAFAQDKDMASEDELALFRKVDAMQVEEIVPLAQEALAEIGCVLDMNDETEFLKALSGKVASHLGHEEPLSDLAVETIGFRTKPAGFAMVEMGMIEINEAENTARLKDCEPVQ